jgi:hypothetical protein
MSPVFLRKISTNIKLMIFSEHSIGTSSLRLNQKQIIPQYLSSVLSTFFFSKIITPSTHEAIPGN